MLNTTDVDVNFYRFSADVVTHNEYYPFGMLVPNRHASSAAYRYGFQGQEKDDELKGEGNSLNYKFRMHDPRVGRFFAVDPLTSDYPWYTPYSFSGNKPIQFIELEGLEENSPSYMLNNYKLKMQALFSVDGQMGMQGKAAKEIEHLSEVNNKDLVLQQLSQDVNDKLHLNMKRNIETMKGVRNTLGAGLAVVVGTPVVIYAAPTIAVIIPEATSVYLTKALGHAGYDAFKQSMVNGFKANKIDIANSLITGATHGKSGIVTDTMKSFIDLTVDDGLNFKNFEEGVTDLALNKTVSLIFGELNVSADAQNGQIIKDLAIKIIKTEAKEQLENFVENVTNKVLQPNNRSFKKDGDQSKRFKVKDNIPLVKPQTIK